MTLAQWIEKMIEQRQYLAHESCSRLNSYDCGYDRGFLNTLIEILHKIEEEK